MNVQRLADEFEAFDQGLISGRNAAVAVYNEKGDDATYEDALAYERENRMRPDFPFEPHFRQDDELMLSYREGVRTAADEHLIELKS